MWAQQSNKRMRVRSVYNERKEIDSINVKGRLNGERWMQNKLERKYITCNCNLVMIKILLQTIRSQKTFKKNKNYTVLFGEICNKNDPFSRSSIAKCKFDVKKVMQNFEKVLHLIFPFFSYHLDLWTYLNKFLFIKES